MSYPTVLGPWYVVQRMKSDGTISGDYVGMEYYTMADEETMWTEDKKRAMIFATLQQASRIAESEVAEVRVLMCKAEAEEFDRA